MLISGVEVPNLCHFIITWLEYIKPNFDKEMWECALYSHYSNKDNAHIVNTMIWKQCIPYEGNEHLVGTTNKSKDE